ncbi:hypothetical protein [Mycolicibacterium wolinskyi]|uniref:hypothetical protein n=1 Tax=Mycolicibacterium wolinskyi TaxID=59750 RepID=UPI000B2DAF97|nr:hypothetical protein [Mycolicibacterium wolinskyi]
MAIADDDLDRMEAAIVAAMSAPGIDERVPDWTTADDLSRIGIEALTDSDPLGRALASRGNVRITGDGVTGSSAKVNEVARVMTGFQRLATAVGAAQAGDKALASIHRCIGWSQGVGMRKVPFELGRLVFSTH